MIFFISSDGTVVKSVPSRVYQGSFNANVIYVVAPIAETCEATVAFKLPNGVWTPCALMDHGNMTKVTVLTDKNGDNFNVWEYALKSPVTKYAGTVTAQFYFHALDSILATATASFTVEKGVPVDLPEEPTEDIYFRILKAMEELYQQIEDGKLQGQRGATGATGPQGVQGVQGYSFYRVISPQFTEFHDGDTVAVSLINVPDDSREPMVGDFILSFRNGYVGQIVDVVYGDAVPAYELGNIFSIKGEAGDYDLIIHTQEEFDEWVEGMENYSHPYPYRSVLLIGGFDYDVETEELVDLKFKRTGKGLHLPDTLYRLDGINNAIIEITDFEYNERANAGGVWYTERPEDNLHSISGLTVRVTGARGVSNNNVSAFRNCANLQYCTEETEIDGDTTNSAYGFYNCKVVVGCKASETTESKANLYAFYNCEQLDNCEGEAENNAIGANAGGMSVAFYGCTSISNCKGASVNFNSVYAFYGCTQLANCSAAANGGITGGASHYSNCSYSSSCKTYENEDVPDWAKPYKVSMKWNGTNTKRDDDSCEI